MEAAGYGDLTGSIDKLVSDRFKTEETTEVSKTRATEGASKINEQMLRMLSDPRLSEELKRKYYVLVTGDNSKQLSPAVSANIVESDDGIHVVTRNVTGDVIQDRIYQNRKIAREQLKKITTTIDKNLTEALESACFENDANEAIETAYLNAKNKLQKGEPTTEQDDLILALKSPDLQAKYERAKKSLQSGETPSESDLSVLSMYERAKRYALENYTYALEIRDQVEKKYGIGTGGLDKAIEGHTKREAEALGHKGKIIEVGEGTYRTEEEQKAIAEYQRLLLDHASKKKIEDTEDANVINDDKNNDNNNANPVSEEKVLLQEHTEDESVPSENNAPQNFFDRINKKKEEAYQRGVAIPEDERKLSDIQKRADIAHSRLEEAFANNQELGKLLVEAISSQDEENFSKLIKDNELSAEQQSAIEGLVETYAEQQGVEDAIEDQLIDYEDERSEALELIADRNGQITKLTLEDGSEVFLKSGDITNEYGGVIVTDEEGNTRQIPVRAIKAVDAPISIDEQIRKEGKEFTDHLTKSYQGIASGEKMIPGQDAIISIAGEKVHVTMQGETGDGRLVLRLDDGSDIALLPEDLADCLKAARREEVETTLQEERAQKAEKAEQKSLLSAIPKDEEGNPRYEQADAETSYDAILEQADGDEHMADDVIQSMISDKKSILKKAEKTKVRAGKSISEKIAAEKERKEAIEIARAELESWEKIAAVPNKRRQEAERKQAEAERKKREDKIKQTNRPNRTLRSSFEEVGIENNENVVGLVINSSKNGDTKKLTHIQAQIIRNKVRKVFENAEDSDNKRLHDAIVSVAHSTSANSTILYYLYKALDAVREGRMSVDEAMALLEAYMYVDDDTHIRLMENLDKYPEEEGTTDFESPNRSETITPEQEALLSRPNSDQYPTERELTGGKGTAKTAEEQGKGGKSSVASKDNQGNPLNADGTLKLEKVKSVDDLTDEDFLKPYRNVELPKLPRKVDEAIGANGQPVVIKKNIFERNAERHNDLTSSQSREILHSALYNPDLYGQSQKAKRPYNWVVINTKDEKGHNRTVLLEISPNKDNIEIVHWHYVDERGLEKIKRQAEREDGQLLILPSAKEEAGALSSPTSGLSSDGKDANNSDNLQEKDKTFSERLQNAIAETEPNPSEAQKKAGNYKKGHLSFGGYDFTVEIPKGAIRSGKDEQGKPWSVTMHDTYGYILGKIGVDGDHIDMFINDAADLDTFDGNVYVVDQVNPETGEFDEHKVMYGYPSEEAATEAYLANYSKGWKGLGKVTSVPKATFDKWLESSDRKTKPFREYVMVQKETEGNKPSEASLSLSTPLTDEEVVKELTESKVLWNRFRGDSNSLGENQGSALTPSANNPSGKDSVLNPHSDAKIRNNIETANGNGGENTGKARQHKADAEYKKAKIKFSKVSNEQAKLDADYLDAVNRGDMETAQRMVNEAAEAAGYSTDSSYQGTSAFNGAAPWGNGYFLTKEERKEAWDNGDFEGESTLGDYINDGIDGGNLEDLTNAASYRAAGPMRKEAIDNVRNAIQKKSKTITMYRSVPSDVKEGKFRNGDWVTPSRAYAVDNAKVHGWGNDYNIIEQKVPVDEVWFDGNDIAEWGYGREEDYIKDTDFAYKNTKNNRKLLDVVTYDDNGNIIPLSQRFNSRKADERYQRGVDGVKPSKAEVTLRDAVIDKLRESGIEVLGAEGQKVLDMANGKDVRLEAKRKRALETASLRNNLRSLTVIPSADGAKVLKKIDILTKELEKLPTQSKTFTGDVAKALGAKRYGSSSEYATFETKNGKVVTIRLSNHNAKMAVLEDTVEKLEQERAAAMSQAVDEEQQHKVQETLDWFAAKISVFSKEEEINTRSCCISFDSYIKPQPRFSPGYISWSTSAHSVNSLLDRKPTTYPSGVPSVSLSGAG